MSKEDKPYKTGYKKPPKESQFKKGQSGNPSGRPKGLKKSLSVLEEILDKDITVYENGEAITINVHEGIFKRLCEKSLKGDMKAMEKMLTLIKELEQKKHRDEVIANYVYERILDNIRRAQSDPGTREWVESILSGTDENSNG